MICNCNGRGIGERVFFVYLHPNKSNSPRPLFLGGGFPPSSFYMPFFMGRFRRPLLWNMRLLYRPSQFSRIQIVYSVVRKNLAHWRIPPLRLKEHKTTECRRVSQICCDAIENKWSRGILTSLVQQLLFGLKIIIIIINGFTIAQARWFYCIMFLVNILILGLPELALVATSFVNEYIADSYVEVLKTAVINYEFNNVYVFCVFTIIL